MAIINPQAFSDTVAADSSVALLIWNTGGVGTVTVDDVAESWDFIQNSVADTTLNSNGTIVESDDGATLGAFADLVEAQVPTSSFIGKWHCTIVAGLRDQDTTDLNTFAAADAKESAGGVEVTWDNGQAADVIWLCFGIEADGTAASPAARLSSHNSPQYRDPTTAGPKLSGFDRYLRPQRVGRAFHLAYLTTNSDTDSVTTVRIYSSTQGADTLLETIPGAADNVVGTKNYNTNQEIVSNPGARLVVRLTEAGTSAATTMDLSGNGGFGDAGSLANR